MQKTLIEMIITFVIVIIAVGMIVSGFAMVTYCSSPEETGFIRDMACIKMDMFLSLIGK